jgi:hypothetical protein
VETAPVAEVAWLLNGVDSTNSGLMFFAFDASFETHAARFAAAAFSLKCFVSFTMPAILSRSTIIYFFFKVNYQKGKWGKRTKMRENRTKT